jgi:hypothetical protein
MIVNPIAKKLGFKPRMQALILAAPPGYLKLLTPLPEGVTISSSSAKKGMHPFVQIFATQLAEIRTSVPELLNHAAPGALVWIAYPKKTSGIESDLSRDVVCAALSGTGWRPVSIVAIDDVWAALRFRPEKDVKAR